MIRIAQHRLFVLCCFLTVLALLRGYFLATVDGLHGAIVDVQAQVACVDRNCTP
jgi:hypothetical protein